MRFYNRNKEIKKLKEIAFSSSNLAQFTVLTGRRRIGKTQLLLKAFEDQIYIYFFVSKKSEVLLCKDFVQELSSKLSVPILGEVSSFTAILEYIFQLSKKQTITLIIDEFQEFYTVNPSIYSDMQRLWDLNKETARLNLIVSGSVISLMHRIFENSKEPLFGRAQHFIRLQPFDTSTLKEILADHLPNYTSEDLLALYSFTGGVAKYVELLMDQKAYKKEAMIRCIASKDSIFISEGKNVLIEEFGKEYMTYFSILSIISEGKNTRSQIEDQLTKEVSGFLTKLEHDFQLIKRVTPILSSPTKHMKYFLEDNFLIFWFRFIYKYNHMTEIGSFDLLQQIIERDYAIFSGMMLERYFRLQASESGNFTHIGSYWDRKGEIEIDMILINDISKTIRFTEIKRNKQKISISSLTNKSLHFESMHPIVKSYTKEVDGLSMENM
ncbi:MAG TPA: ATP-binding protein [Saprospiraceae bacterium]|nr:ATP-binding protein [Saprospiraceae bacterium]